MEPVVRLQLSNNHNCNYSMNLDILPYGIYNGIGNWTTKCNISENNLIGIQILTGGGEFIGCGNPSTVLFKAKLQFTKKIDRIIPYPDPKPETTIWEGCLSLVGGSVQGFLSRTNGSHYPNCYNLNAVYTKLKEGDTIVINVSNIKLSI
jgi:hypothetical protein